MEDYKKDSTAVCLIASAGNFDGKKAKAKIKNSIRKNGSGLNGCLEDITIMRNYLHDKDCNVTDLIIRYKQSEATLPKDLII